MAMDELTFRVRARISAKNARHLEIQKRNSGITKSRIIDDALNARFSLEFDDQRDARIIKQLNMMMRHDLRQSRDMNFLMEVQALFLQYFFTLMPQPSASNQDVCAAKGVKLLNDFIDQLGGRMEHGGKTFKKALNDILVTDEDFFSLEETELLQALSKKRLGART